MPDPRTLHDTDPRLTDARRRLEEAEETIDAIRTGHVDAFLVEHPSGRRVYTLETAERPYRVMVENMHQGALMLAHDGIALFCNQAFGQLVHANPREVIGSRLARWVPPEQQALLDEVLAAHRSGAARRELTLVRSDGQEVPVEITVTPMPLDGLDGFCAIVTDLTERREREELFRTQQALQESEQRFRVLFEQAPVGIVESDIGTDEFVRANPAFEVLTGYSVEELAHLRKHGLTHPDDRADDLEQERIAFEQGKPRYRREKRYVRKDGTIIFVDVTVSILRDARGRPVRRLAAVIDVTDRKATEARLKEADRRKDEFLATLAHELRNPLAPIRNAVAVLRQKAMDTPVVEWSRDVIDRQIQQMARLVDDLLDLSRITRDSVSLHPNRVTLGHVIRSAVETSQPLIDAGGHHLTVKLPPGSVILYADATRLAQVFANLLNNAAKYTPPGGHIDVTARLEGDWVDVSVRDTGAGIPAEMLDRIFDMFTQVDRTLERAQTGLGIGLSLARGLVELHGGTIRAQSGGLGQGSEFTVSLPLAGAAPRTRRTVRSGSRATSRPAKVLIVDDNRDAADSLAMVLALEGHDVRTAYDGPAAIELARAFEPRLVLLDLGMPAMNGYEACERIRAALGKTQPVMIALTGWGQDADRRRSREAGFDHHLVKPVEPDMLFELIHAAAAHADSV